MAGKKRGGRTDRRSKVTAGARPAVATPVDPSEVEDHRPVIERLGDLKRSLIYASATNLLPQEERLRHCGMIALTVPSIVADLGPADCGFLISLYARAVRVRTEADVGHFIDADTFLTASLVIDVLRARIAERAGERGPYGAIVRGLARKAARPMADRDAEILARWQAGESERKLAREFGVTASAIRKARQRARRDTAGGAGSGA